MVDRNIYVVLRDYVIGGHQFYMKQKVELIDNKLWFWTFNDEGQRDGRSYVEVTDEQVKDLIENTIIVPSIDVPIADYIDYIENPGIVR